MTGIAIRSNTLLDSRRMRRIPISLAAPVSLALVLLIAAGCGPVAPGTTHGSQANLAERLAAIKPFAGKYPINVVCTTGMVADLVRNVGGEHVDVTQLMQADVDPHLYKASPGDRSLLSGADLIFYSGLHLEGKMTEIFEHMTRVKPTFAITEQLEEAGDSRLFRIGETYDPHVWFDVGLWGDTIEVVTDALCAFDPPHADSYRGNAVEFSQQLDELHDYARSQFATIPKSHRVLVTAHDAFHYMGRAYDVEVKAIQGISTDNEAGVREVEDLVAFIVDRNVKAVFIETTISKRNIDALIEGCRHQGHQVIVGGELFSDAMGKVGTPEGTYIGMVRHNVDTIVNALK